MPLLQATHSVILAFEHVSGVWVKFIATRRMSAPLEEPPLWTPAHAGAASSLCASTILRGTAFGTAVDTALMR